MRPSRGIHRLAVATAASTFVLLFVGGLVTSTGSALAVPDWPLSFGQVFPPMVGGVLFEHGHRLVATLVGCLTLVLALWIAIAEPRPAVRASGLVALLVATTVARAARSPRAELRRPALVAAALVVVQVALGASIIWTRRAVVPTTSHVALGAALLATCFALTLRAVRLGVRRSAEPVPIGFRREVPA